MSLKDKNGKLFMIDDARFDPIIDFIVKLLKLQKLIIRIKYNLILVIIDRLIKYTCFILYKESSIVEDLIQVTISTRQDIKATGLLNT